MPTALGFGWYQLKKTPCSSKQLWGNKTSWKFLLAFMYSRSGLVLFIWFFHWAPAAMDGTEWSWDNLRTSLLTLLLNPLLRTFFSCLYFFFFLSFYKQNAVVWEAGLMGWIRHALLRGMMRLETGAFCLLPISPSLPLGGHSLSSAYSSPHPHTAVVTKIQSALDWLLWHDSSW